MSIQGVTQCARKVALAGEEKYPTLLLLMSTLGVLPQPPPARHTKGP